MDISGLPVSIIFLKVPIDRSRAAYEITRVNSYFVSELKRIDVGENEFTGDINNYISEDVTHLNRSSIAISISKKVINATVSFYNSMLFVEVMVCGNSFVRFINHELKTPIMSNIELLNLLSNTKMNKHQDEILGMMKINALEFTRTLNDTIEYLNLLSKKVEVKNEEFSMLSLMDNIKPTIHGDNINVMYPLEDFKIRSDYSKVLYVIKSIVNNCLLSKNTRFIYIKASRPDKKIIKFSISDDGDRLEEDKALMLFNGFLNISDEMLTHKRHSSGLGMVVSKQTSKILGGDLTLTYNENFGNIYEFTLVSL
jgi:K+-sensing histidine kinase KdpD